MVSDREGLAAAVADYGDTIVGCTLSNGTRRDLTTLTTNWN